MLKSYRLNRQVVEELNLDIEYYEVGAIKTTQLWEAPFVVKKQVPEAGFNRNTGIYSHIGGSPFFDFGHSREAMASPLRYI